MSKEDFERFREMVFLDALLQKQLRRHHDRDLFINCVIKLGKSFNLEITVEDISEEMALNRRRLWVGSESANNAG